MTQRRTKSGETAIGIEFRKRLESLTEHTLPALEEFTRATEEDRRRTRSVFPPPLRREEDEDAKEPKEANDGK